MHQFHQHQSIGQLIAPDELHSRASDVWVPAASLDRKVHDFPDVGVETQDAMDVEKRIFLFYRRGPHKDIDRDTKDMRARGVKRNWH